MKRKNLIPAVLAIVFLSGVGLASEYQTSLLSQNTSQPPPPPAPSSQPVSDVNNIARTIKDRETYLSDLKRQVSDIKKETKGTVDTSKVEGVFQQYEKCIQEFRACPATITDNNYGVCWDKDSECNPYVREIEDELNDNLRPVRDCANNRKNINDRKKEKKSNLDRQIKDILRQDKSADVSQLNAIISQIDAQFAKADQQGTACNSDTSDVLNDIQSELNELFNDFYNLGNEVSQKANEGQQLKDASRQIKDKERQLKDFQRESKNQQKRLGAENELVKQLQQYVSDYQAALDRAKQCISASDTQCFWDENTNMEDASRNFWDFNNEAGQQANLVEQGKNLKRSLKDFERNVKQMESEYKRSVKSAGSDIPEAKASLEEYRRLLEAAKACVPSQEDDCNQYFMDMSDIQQTFWNILNESRSVIEEAKIQQYQDFEIKNLISQLEDSKQRIGRSKLSLEDKEVCRDFADRALGLANQMVSDPKLGEKLEVMGESVPPACEEIFENIGEGGGPVNVHNFVQEFDFQEITEKQIQSIVDRISQDLVSKVLERIATQIDESVLKKLINIQGKENQAQISALLEYTSTSFVPEQYAVELVENKAEFFDLGAKVKAIASRPGCEGLNALKAKVESAAIVGSSADELFALVTEFTEQNAGASGNACKNAVNALAPKIDDILARGQEEAYQKKVTPFKDTGAGQYYVGAVAELASRGIVSGKKDASGHSLGVFDPAAKVKVTEMLRMIFEASGVGKAKNAPESCNGKYASHWAAGYIAQAENAGLAVVASCGDLNRDATRGEVVQMILEAASIVPERGDYAGYAQKIGLIKGGPDGNLRLSDSINRAEAATVLKRALTLFSQESVEF